MKNTHTLFALFITLISIPISAQNVIIPDANFKAYLIGNTAINTNGDTEIQMTEATAFTGLIGCYNQNITDLTGIEAFTNLTELNCYGNQLTTIDVSNNTALTFLSCHNNQLTSLDISTNTLLTKLQCNNNQLDTLNVSNNPLLTDIFCFFNQLTSLDLTNNTALNWLYCNDNLLTDLDVRNNTNLTILSAGNNQLTSVNAKNGNNTNIFFFSTSNNLNLACIEVDDAAWSTANWSSIDSTSYFSNNCSCDSSTTSLHTDVVSSCGDFTWIDGNTYTSNNTTAQHILMNALGCDSIITLNLTIKNVSTTTDSVTSCSAYTWINGITYTSGNNTAKDTLTNALGCDSIISLHLTINNLSNIVDTVTTCSSSYTWIDGITYTTNNNTATDTLSSFLGCDSIVRLELTLLSSKRTTVDTTISSGESLTIGTNTYTTNGTYIDTLSSSNGCDSIVTTTLSISDVNSIASLSANSVKVFPNPFHDMIMVKLPHDKIDRKVVITDLLGRQQNVPIEIIGMDIKIDASDLAKGSYIIQILEMGSIKILKK